MSAYYVSPLGSDGGTGSALDPWKTLQKAADTVTSGDAVTVRAGVYAGFVLLSSHSGAAGSPITFTAEPGATINTAGRYPDGINLEGASYVTIEGFTINNPLGTITRAGIRSVTNDHVVIRNNTIDGMGRWGVFSGFSDDILIENNSASHSQLEHGIYVSNSGDRPVIRGNTVFGNTNCGIHMNGDGNEGGDGVISGALVENNVIYENSVGGGSAINADGVQGSVFRNNLLYNNHASGISLFRMDGAAPSTGNLVINNTIVVASDGRWCVNITNGSTGNTVLNNVLDNRNLSRGAITISSDSLGGFQSDYNLIINNRFTPNASTNMTLSQWQAATGQDLHSRLSTEAATFVNASLNDYRLRGDSPAVDAGTAANAPSRDIAGNVRPRGAGYDIGAYEYQPVQVTLTGDANGDGLVDFADFVVLSNNFGIPDRSVEDGDFNGDGVVDFADFVILSNSFGISA